MTEDGDQEFEIRHDERDEGVSTPGSVSDTMSRFAQRMMHFLTCRGVFWTLQGALWMF